MSVRLLLLLAVAASAAPRCVVLNAAKDGSEAIITCSDWAPGFSRTLRAPSSKEWAEAVGLPVPQDTVKVEK